MADAPLPVLCRCDRIAARVDGAFLCPDCGLTADACKCPNVFDAIR